jgi:hypothetical protein
MTIIHIRTKCTTPPAFVCDISWSSVLFVNEGTAYGIFLLGRGDWSIVKLGFQCSQLNASSALLMRGNDLRVGFFAGRFSSWGVLS